MGVEAAVCDHGESPGGAAQRADGLRPRERPGKMGLHCEVIQLAADRGFFKLRHRTGMNLYAVPERSLPALGDPSVACEQITHKGVLDCPDGDGAT